MIQWSELSVARFGTDRLLPASCSLSICKSNHKGKRNFEMLGGIRRLLCLSLSTASSEQAKVSISQANVGPSLG